MPALAAQAIAVLFLVFAISGCASGGGGLLGESASAMSGRWMLGAPGAPPCGVEFRDAGGDGGQLTPDGGCPGEFYRARRWGFEGDKLSIKTEDNEPLVQLENKGGRFEGKSVNGVQMTLTR